MPQIINTNIMSMNSQRNLNKSQSSMGTALQRLSSGLRINSAKDDAAGLAITERFTAQIRGLKQAVRNANDGISMSQVAEGALAEVSNMMQRVRELSVQAINDTNSSSDRQALNNEVSQLLSEINRIAKSTEFNGQKVLDGSLTDLSFQVGAYKGQTIEVDGVDAQTSSLGYTNAEGATRTRGNISAAISANDLTINGYGIDLSGLTTSTATVQDIADVINNYQADTGITAETADSTSIVQAYSSANATAGTLTLNGVSVGIAAGATTTATVAQINKFTDSTGITASSGTPGQITFSNTDGSNIEMTDSAEDAFTALGVAKETFYAGLSLYTDYGETISVSTGTTDTQLGTISGITATDSQFSNTKIVTKSDAEAALKTIDFALGQVSSKRAELGAVQNRFQSTIANLETAVENLSASRSRIQDADFAVETAELTRTQILQQAGVAMLAQANSLPQNVLSLLQ